MRPDWLIDWLIILLRRCLPFDFFPSFWLVVFEDVDDNDDDNDDIVNDDDDNDGWRC